MVPGKAGFHVLLSLRFSRCRGVTPSKTAKSPSLKCFRVTRFSRCSESVAHGLLLMYLNELMLSKTLLSILGVTNQEGLPGTQDFQP